MENRKKCLNCGKELFGRVDKKYCDSYCKSEYQYSKSKEEPLAFYHIVDRQLKHNRKILKHYNKAGMVIINAAVLFKMGFNPNFFTHYWKNKKGEIYLFVYEYGFLKKIENRRTKFILVIWQDYMKP